MLILNRYACNKKLVTMMRERTLGNSSTSLIKKLNELHSEEWLRRTARYLSACEAFHAFAPDTTTIASPPPLHPLPHPRWLMTVYLKDVVSRLPDTLAVITSTTGKILKMDSTKKVT